MEYAVEDAPVIQPGWQPDRVPLSSGVRARGSEPARIVLFRRPLERRAGSRAELAALVHTVLVEQLAELIGLTPEEVDPDYRADG